MNISWPRDRVFPQFSEPKQLEVVDLRTIDFRKNWRWLPLIILQGLVNREEPRIYLLLSNRDLDLLKLIEKHAIKVIKSDLNEVFEKYIDYAKGYIVFDPDVPDTLNVANTLSGLVNAIVVSPIDIEWGEEQGLKCLEDFRGRFRSRLEVYEWAYRELWPKIDKRLLAPMKPYSDSRLIQIAFRDYVTATKIFAHYLDPREPKERELFCRLLKEMPDNSAVLGWYEGSEHITVRLASEYRKFVVVVTGSPFLTSNLTVWSGIRVECRYPLPPVDFSKLGKDKVYVTFYMNDGDNIQWDFMMKDFWEDPDRGKIPIAWTISPFLKDLAPLIMKYYAETASSQDTFVSGPSGAGYWYPNVNPDYVDTFLRMSRKYLEESGLKFTEILGEFLDGESLPKYAETGLLAIKLGYRGMDIFPYHLKDSPVPVIPGAVEFWEGEEDKVYGWLKAIATVYKKRPLHALIICVPWRYKTLKPLKIVADKLSSDEDFVLVNFHEFVAMLNPVYGLALCKKLLEEAKKRKLPKEIVSEAESCISRAEEFCSKKEWKEALNQVNKVYRLLGPRLFSAGETAV
ncbi:MAG: hypothetical protein DRJ63_06540 [Thermoprotei archaeon]|nr:MAG: hypothetical protein DRJ63_06540 [Thermoprotei archaeon]